jgi:hypothetical protein
MSYTDINDGMWFSYILGPAADGIFEEYEILYPLNPAPCARNPSIRCLIFLDCGPDVFAVDVCSDEYEDLVKGLFSDLSLAFGIPQRGTIVCKYEGQRSVVLVSNEGMIS